MTMKTRDILCDSGSLISLTAACLDRLLYFFHENYHLRFIIPPSVEYESVRRPLESNLRKYLFSAIRIKNAIDDGVIVKVDADVAARTTKFMDAANNMYFARGKPLRLIQQGETEMVALAKTLGVEYILIDERTTRMLIEAPLKALDGVGQCLHLLRQPVALLAHEVHHAAKVVGHGASRGLDVGRQGLLPGRGPRHGWPAGAHHLLGCPREDRLRVGEGAPEAGELLAGSSLLDVRFAAPLAAGHAGGHRR
jgi:hypothetical protein